MEIWRLATCGHGLQRSSLHYIHSDAHRQTHTHGDLVARWSRSTNLLYTGPG